MFHHERNIYPIVVIVRISFRVALSRRYNEVAVYCAYPNSVHDVACTDLRGYMLVAREYLCELPENLAHLGDYFPNGRISSI